MNRFYLGLSTSGHDPALAVVDEAGTLLFAEATERFLQDKRAWAVVPDHYGHLVRSLAQAGIETEEAVVATTWNGTKEDGPTEVMNTLLPASDGAWLRRVQMRVHRAAGENLMRYRGLCTPPVSRQFEHHLCHAAFAAWSAPFDDALCLVLDGEGDVGAVSLYRLQAGRLKRLWRSWGPASLGSYYALLTGLCGFDWMAGEEWKVMGLAAFGKPDADLTAILRQTLTVENGRLLLPKADTLVEAHRRLAGRRRGPGEPVLSAAEVAASGQAVYAELVDAILLACQGSGTDNLILAGGCALNSSYNGTIVGRTSFRALHVPCAPADDGNAIGAALLAWMQDHPGQPLPRSGDRVSGTPYLGTRPDPKAIADAAQHSAEARVVELGETSAEELASMLGGGKIVGVLRGRAEFGPRALGQRSILADPRPADMKDRINQRVKGREPYRPFAPMIPAECASDWFHNAQPSPYMSLALRWKENKQDLVPAVVHEDGTGRLQTVRQESQPWLHRLLSAFQRQTGVPIVLNTSFNVMGKPIVDTVQDAMAVLATTGLDAVLLENTLIEKRTA